MRYINIICTAALVSLSTVAGLSVASAQSPLNWHMQAPHDSVYGANVEEAYALLHNKKSKPVTVAVIGAGFDLQHEDLKDVLWTNPKEIKDNKKDDDKNGYVDDIHGWNFLGKADGTNIMNTSDASFRAFEKHKQRFMELLDKGMKKTTAEEKEMMSLMQMGQASAVEQKLLSYALTKTVADYMPYWDKKMKEAYPDSTDFTFDTYSKFCPPKTADPFDPRNASYTVNMLLWNFSRQQRWSDRMKHRYDHLDDAMKVYNEALAAVRDDRAKIGDNMEDVNDRFYGNNDLTCGDPQLGTAVMGIIGAKRNNGIGMDGIADNVRLMAIRAIPQGDEYDKDLAVALRYAADNGARVVMLTSVKRASNHRKMVDDAVAYCAKKNVLIVHPAGDEFLNIDSIAAYPTGHYADGSEMKNFINVAASLTNGNVMPTTNYGKRLVDVFAPGQQIYTCDTGDNYFKIMGSTAAAAIVAGEAVLLSEYFPKLSAEQLKEIIIATATTAADHRFLAPRDPNGGIQIGGAQPKKISYSDLGRSQGIVNVKAAVEAAEKH